jgi:hypothetical protein
MGSLPKFRGNLVVFACALVFVVVMIFGNEGGGGMEDIAAASGSQGLEAPPSAANPASGGHDVVLTLGKAKHSNPWLANDRPGAEPSAAPVESSDSAAAPSPDAIQIHG